MTLFALVITEPRRNDESLVQLAHAPSGLVLRPERGIAARFSLALL